MIGLMRMFLPLPTLAVALALPFSGVAAQTAPPPPLSAIAHQLEQAPSGARYGLLVATLATVEREVERQDFSAPALIVIGDIVSMRDLLTQEPTP